jgi:hypothetical protein
MLLQRIGHRAAVGGLGEAVGCQRGFVEVVAQGPFGVVGPAGELAQAAEDRPQLVEGHQVALHLFEVEAARQDVRVLLQGVEGVPHERLGARAHPQQRHPLRRRQLDHCLELLLKPGQHAADGGESSPEREIETMFWDMGIASGSLKPGLSRAPECAGGL